MYTKWNRTLDGGKWLDMDMQPWLFSYVFLMSGYFQPIER